MPTQIRRLIVLSLFFPSFALALGEFKSNFYPSIGLVGRNDLIFSSHNTLLFGGGGFYIGVYGAFETISQNVIDQAVGGAVRFGEDTYIELQGGYFERKFSQQATRLTGKGYSGNLILGTHLTRHFGLALFLSGKRIESGMDKRWIADLLPFLTLRTGF